MAVGGDNNIITYNTINMNGINPYTYAIDIGASWTDGTATIKGLSIAMGASSRQSIDDDFNEKMIEADNNMYIHKKFIKSIAKS